MLDETTPPESFDVRHRPLAELEGYKSSMVLEDLPTNLAHFGGKCR